MASPAICIRDTSISNGQILVKDMWPNRSQANPVVDPAPQGPRYLRVVEVGIFLWSGGCCNYRGKRSRGLSLVTTMVQMTLL